MLKFQRNPWNVFLGDCSVVTTYLADKPLTSLSWAPVHVLNIFLRAVGQVCYVVYQDNSINYIFNIRGIGEWVFF